MRWVQQTDFQNEEAVGYLADRLEKLGVEDELFRAGAIPGATVVIGEGDGIIFDWEPAAQLGRRAHDRAARHRPASDAEPPTHHVAAPRAVPRPAWTRRPRHAPNSKPSGCASTGWTEEDEA